MTPAVTLGMVRAAAARLAGRVARTPTIEIPALSAATGIDLRLKLETVQHTGSFKVRGALNRLIALAPEERRTGVIAVSAGNHAQAVAFHARALGIAATIVMPANSPFTKIRRTESHGARVILHGVSLAEAADHAGALREREGLVFIPPYDDPLVVAGQGTAGLELLEDAPEVDCVVVPMGGGGLIAGSAVALRGLKPALTVHGVETALFGAWRHALGGGAPGPGGVSLADGIAVKQPGAVTLPLVRALVSEVFQADEALVERAVRVLAQHRILAEGAGAAALAPILAAPRRFAGRTVGLLVSGGNIDDRLLASILMRGLIRDDTLVRLRIEVTDTPGSLAAVTGLIAEGGANIIEVEHRRLFEELPVRRIDIDVLLEARDRGHVEGLRRRLAAAGFPADLMTAPE